MKITRHSTVGLLVGLIALLSVSCSNTTTYEEALEKNRTKIDEPERLDDARFVVEMKSLNMFQLRLLELASQTGYSSELVNLGKENINTFKTLAEDLTDVARSEEIRLPTEMSTNHQARINEIQQTPRQEIDQKIIGELRASNEETLGKLTTMATEAFDADVRAFAARKIGALRAHLNRVKTVEEGLLTTVKEE